MRRFGFLLLVGLAAAALPGAACGSGGDDGVSGSDATPFVSISESDETPDAGDDAGDGAAPNDSPDTGDDSGDGDDGGVPDDVDACALLTTDEVAAAAGATVGEGEPFESPPFYDCQWLAEDGGINVSVFSGDRDEVESFFEIGHEYDEEVDDVGEAAFWDDELQNLEVLSGNYSVAISLAGVGQLTLETAIELAELAIGRLP